ncbi:MAG: ABC transporter ATP-binding protein [Bacteroidota bacterium]
MIDILGVSKVYSHGIPSRRTVALREFSLSVPQGSSVGLIGPNGSGKTTLFKILVDLLRPTAGRVTVFGRSPVDPDVRRRIGYLPERFHVPKYFTGYQVLKTAGRMYGMDEKALEEQTERMLEFCSLTEWKKKETSRYSKGMRQQLGLAQALINEPDLLLLDEPLEGMDPRARLAFKDALRNTRQHGTTLFFSSHVLSDVEELCERVAIIEQGSLTAFESVTTLTATSGFQLSLPAQHPSLAAVEDIAGLPVSWMDGAARLRVPDAVMLRKVLEELDHLQIPVESIESVKGHLEDLFFRREKNDDNAHS